MRITFDCRRRLKAFAPALLLAVPAGLAAVPEAQAVPNWCMMNRGVTGIVQRDLDHLSAATSKPGWTWGDPQVQDAVSWIGTDLSTTINRLDRATRPGYQDPLWGIDDNPWEDDYSEYADLLQGLDGAIDGQADAATLKSNVDATEAKTRALAANCEGEPVPMGPGPIHPNPPNN